MKKDLMFYCIPQGAYMRTENCQKLRQRPTGTKVSAGTQPRLRACEVCTMYPLVDALKVPTVSMAEYLAGRRPETVDLEAPSIKRALKALRKAS
ncbi:MAG: hypothetical protein D6721_07220 [Gammaproteobacteria bacterium]|nr:MAG: hypothetical protein D6721_07220 [Gammaproteobacteria bacterium]